MKNIRLGFLIGCLFLQNASGEIPGHSNANGDLVVPIKDVDGLKVRALKGDGSAALKLALDPTHNTNYALYWLTISAEDGDVRGMEWLGVFLHQKTDPPNEIRACFWLQKAGAGDQCKNP